MKKFIYTLCVLLLSAGMVGCETDADDYIPGYNDQQQEGGNDQGENNNPGEDPGSNPGGNDNPGGTPGGDPGDNPGGSNPGGNQGGETAEKTRVITYEASNVTESRAMIMGYFESNKDASLYDYGFYYRDAFAADWIKVGKSGLTKAWDFPATFALILSDLELNVNYVYKAYGRNLETGEEFFGEEMYVRPRFYSQVAWTKYLYLEPTVNRNRAILHGVAGVKLLAGEQVSKLSIRIRWNSTEWTNKDIAIDNIAPDGGSYTYYGAGFHVVKYAVEIYLPEKIDTYVSSRYTIEVDSPIEDYTVDGEYTERRSDMFGTPIP